MHVDRAGRLMQLRVANAGQRGRGECGRRFHFVSGGVEPVHVHLVLAFDVGVHPRLRRMEVDVTRTIVEPVAPADDVLRIGELAVVEAEDLDRTRVLGPAVLRVVAARREDHDAVRWSDDDLMRVDADIDAVFLLHLRSQRAIGIDGMDGDVARIVEGAQHVRTRGIHAVVNGPRG